MKSKCAILTDKNIIEIKEIKTPCLRKGDVLVEICYSGLCGTQIGEIRGTRGEDRFIPHLLGHEASGRVIEIGFGVTKVDVGDNVVCSWIKGYGLESGPKKYDDKYNAGSISTFQEYSVISENRLFKISDKIPKDIVSLLGCMIPTGLGTATNILNIDKDSKVVVFGCGNIGSAAILGAKYKEAKEIIVVDKDSTKSDYALRLGATIFANVPTPDIKNADYVIEATGSKKIMEIACDIVKDTGVVVIAGNLSPDKKLCINPVDLNKGKIKGSWGGFVDRQHVYMDKFIEFVEKHYKELALDKIKLKKYRLDKINDAVEDFESSSYGKILIGGD